MGKELDAFNKIVDYEPYSYRLEEFSELVDIIEKALQRLEAIDNANPNEALNQIDFMILDCVTTPLQHEALNTVKQALLKAQEQEKAIEIIFEQDVDIDFLKSADTFEEYNKLIKFKAPFAVGLTQEEFDLLKDMQKDE